MDRHRFRDSQHVALEDRPEQMLFHTLGKKIVCQGYVFVCA